MGFLEALPSRVCVGFWGVGDFGGVSDSSWELLGVWEPMAVKGFDDAGGVSGDSLLKPLGV
jgi:hypothetical protein